MTYRSPLLALWLFLAAGHGLAAAAPTITARFEPATLAVGETAELKIVLKDVAWEAWRGLRFPGVAGLHLAKASSSASTTRSAGKLQHEHTITLALRPERPGHFVVPAQVLRWGDQTVTMPEATLHVSPAPSVAAPAARAAGERVSQATAQAHAGSTRDAPWRSHAASRP